MRVIGLMSGTSADGVDAALVELQGAPPFLRWRLLQHTFVPYPPELRAELFACFQPAQGTVDRLCALNVALGEFFAEAALRCMNDAQLDADAVDLIGSHGQTLWHIPGRATLQLGEASVIAERTGVPVVSNFRARDIAAGGQGAPLVAYVDVLLLSHPTLARTALNVGGIANFTYLPPTTSNEQPFAFDSGPGNVLIDAAVQRLTKGAWLFDRGGSIAASAQPDLVLLEELLQHPYFRQSPPKTTGRELFGTALVDEIWQKALQRGLSGERVVATLTLLTARTIAEAHHRFLPRLPKQVLVSGGGVRNATLMRWLAELLAPAEVLPTDAVGLPAAAKEAIAFAVLAYETWHGRPGNLPSATGARQAVILGQITPAGQRARRLASSQLTEAVNPDTVHIDCLPTPALVAVINAEDQKVAQAVAEQSEAIARAIDAIAERMRAGGRLVYVGAGTSGRLGVLDASEIPPTFNMPPERVIGLIAGGDAALRRALEGAEDDVSQGEADIEALHIDARDCVLGISASGSTPYVLAALKAAQRRGALTVGLTCNPETPLHQVASIVIAPLVGPEVITGSTRMKSGTATKLVLNTISTGVMIRLGKTFGNLMVDVQLTNAKLRRRAVRIVAAACGIREDEASALLERCGGETKVAIVSHLAQCSPERARRVLEAHEGSVRRALHALTGRDPCEA